MAAMLFYLSRYPAALERVTAEVRGKFGSIEEIRSGAKLNSCTYLRACIDETLRISPPSGSALWRQVIRGGAIFDRQYIPAGYDVGVGIYAIHHNPDYYPDPHAFKPERWLSDPSDGVEVGGMQKLKLPYAPFSAGPRGCVGKGLALTKLMLTMAHILYSLDMKEPGPLSRPGKQSSLNSPSQAQSSKTLSDEFQTRDHITSAKAGPLLKFRRRLRGFET